MDCLKYLLDLNYIIDYLEFLTLRRRKQVKTQAKIQPFCKFANIDCIGYINGKEVLPMCLKQKNKFFYIHNIQFCVIFKSEGVSLKQAAEEVKSNFNYESRVAKNDNWKKVELYSFEPKKINNQLNIVLPFEFETFNDGEKAVPYAGAFYPVSELIIKWNRDLTNEKMKNV